MTKIRTIALLLAVIIVSFASSGCDRINEKLDGIVPTDSPAPTEAAATSAPSPVPAVYPGNEVFGMLNRFFEVYGSAADGMVEAVYSLGDRAIMSECFLLLHDEAYVARLFASVGMLVFDEESSYCSGTVTGAYAGSGYMLPGGDFEYDFEAGGSVSGSITDGRRIEAYFKEGVKGVTIKVNRLGEGFLFLVGDGGVTGICEVRDGYLCYGRFPTSQIFDIGDGGFPDIAGVEKLIYSGGAVSFSE